MRTFGSEELAAQAAQHGLKSGELQALAVKATADRFGPLTFGPVVDRREHEKKTEESQKRLDAIYAQMREVVCGADLTWSQEGLFQEEIRRGLSRASFKRLPDLGPNHGEWPKELVVALATAPKPKRERISKPKAA